MPIPPGLWNCCGTLLLALLPMLLAGSARAEAAQGMHYRVKVRIDPASHRLEAEVWIQQPPTARFFLNREFSVREVLADGKRVPFRRDEAGEGLPFVLAAGPVVAEAKDPRQLYVKYDGEMREVANAVNLISPDLVELAYYSAWYPLFGMADATFEIELDMPAGWLATTNGQLKKQREKGGRAVTLWASYRPGFDLALFASPHLRCLTGGVKGARVEVYGDQSSEEFLRAQVDGLVQAMNRLADLYGAPRVKSVLRVAYSPRGGWGYSRIPLIVLSGEQAKEAMSTPAGQAEEFQGECHEMAHFWWNLADAGTPEDWINEGLAEFSAYRLADERFGKAFAETLLQRYRDHAAATRTDSSIVETEGSSPDRYVNRYEKTALMFVEARRRFGSESLDTTLRSLYAQCARGRQATTALFLEEVRLRMGAEAEEFFRSILYRKGVISQPTPAAQ